MSDTRLTRAGKRWIVIGNGDPWSRYETDAAYRAAVDARWAAKQSEFHAFDASMDAEIASRRIYA